MLAITCKLDGDEIVIMFCREYKGDRKLLFAER